MPEINIEIMSPVLALRVARKQIPIGEILKRRLPPNSEVQSLQMLVKIKGREQPIWIDVPVVKLMQGGQNDNQKNNIQENVSETASDRNNVIEGEFSATGKNSREETAGIRSDNDSEEPPKGA